MLECPERTVLRNAVVKQFCATIALVSNSVCCPHLVGVKQKVVEEEELVALNPRQKVALPLEEKESLSDSSRRFRFSLPSKQHKLGLPVGKVRTSSHAMEIISMCLLPWIA